MRPLPLGALLLAALAPAAAADPPLSAVGWLTDRLAAPAPPGTPAAPAAGSPPALPDPPVEMAPLAPAGDAGAGLFPAARAGLPHGLWGAARIDEAVAALAAELPDLPAPARELHLRLLLAEAPPPSGGGVPEDFLLARIDRLMALGALDAALALIEVAGAPTPPRLRRLFDIALLLDVEERACPALLARADLPAGAAAQVFCLARSGNWAAATLAFRSAAALGLFAPSEAALLARFLDLPGSGTAPLAPPDAPTPLAWRLHEAIGEPLATAGLPLAFAHTDIESAAGWRAQILAGERLYRTGAIPGNRLLGLYTARTPAASGGVWERAAAVRALEAALAEGRPAGVAAALAAAWTALAAAGLEALLGEVYGEALADRALPPPSDALAFRIALLSPAAARAARARTPAGAEERFLIAVATGRTPPAAPDGLRAAVRDGLAGQAAPAWARAPAAEGRAGLALLQALERIDAGARGDPQGVTEGLAALVALGLEEPARRIALSLLLLGPRG